MMHDVGGSRWSSRRLLREEIKLDIGLTSIGHWWDITEVEAERWKWHGGGGWCRHHHKNLKESGGNLEGIYEDPKGRR
jgi:hypothetical protein